MMDPLVFNRLAVEERRYREQLADLENRNIAIRTEIEEALTKLRRAEAAVSNYVKSCVREAKA